MTQFRHLSHFVYEIKLLWVELCFFFSNSITVGDLSLAEGSTVQDWRQELALTRRDWILSHPLRVCHSLSAAEYTISGLLPVTKS